MVYWHRQAKWAPIMPKLARSHRIMRQHRLFLLCSGVVALVLLVGFIDLALTLETISPLVPAGSREIQLKSVTPWEARISYKLPRGETWTAIYDRLRPQGWDIYDDGPNVLWPDLMDDSRTIATFRRLGWFNLVHQWLTVRRVSLAPAVFTVEIVQCVRFAPVGMCT
jgi:hypothetical protein